MRKLGLKDEPQESAVVQPRSEAAAPVTAGYETLQEQTYRKLRKSIREGWFVSGQALTVRGLAAMLGVSPMPIREAVRRLAQENTLEVLPNRTMRVPLLSSRRFDELAEVRAELEGFAAGRAAERISEPQFAEITSANEAMSRAVDLGDLVAVNLANERFHFSIYRAAQSDTLLAVIDNLWQQSGPYLASLIERLVLGKDAPSHFALVHHYTILAALGKHDVKAAREAMKTDIVESARWYRSHTTLQQSRAETGRKAP